MCIFCDTNPDKVRKYGKIFGYPECCIEEFISDMEINRLSNDDSDVRNEEQIEIARSTWGFVPCKMHTQMIMEGKTTPEHLVRKTRNAKKAAKLNVKAANAHF